MSIGKNDVYFTLSLVFVTWFALTSAAWAYFANLFISFPFLILSYICRQLGKKTDTKQQRYRVIPYIWGAGAVISLLALIFIR